MSYSCVRPGFLELQRVQFAFFLLDESKFWRVRSWLARAEPNDGLGQK